MTNPAGLICPRIGLAQLSGPQCLVAAKWFSCDDYPRTSDAGSTLASEVLSFVGEWREPTGSQWLEALRRDPWCRTTSQRLPPRGRCGPP